MRIFLAGATGVIGQRLAALLRDARHEVTGTTRNPAKGAMLRALDITPIVVDVFESDAVAQAVATVRPDVVIHQLTDLPSAPGTPGYPAAQEANRRLRIEGTRNLMQAAKNIPLSFFSTTCKNTSGSSCSCGILLRSPFGSVMAPPMTKFSF